MEPVSLNMTAILNDPVVCDASMESIIHAACIRTWSVLGDMSATSIPEGKFLNSTGTSKIRSATAAKKDTLQSTVGSPRY